MTLPPVVRVFFAIDLPTAAKEKLGRFIGSLKKKSRTHAIRWSKPENLHITLQFLAEVRSEHIQTMLQNVRQEMEGAVRHSTFNMGRLHLFPDPYRPRVIVLDVTPQSELNKLAILIGQGIQKTHYEIEDRPFRAHLTIGRIKQPQGLNMGFLSECTSPELEEMALREVVFFRSEPQPEGSRYSPIERISIRDTSTLGPSHRHIGE